MAAFPEYFTIWNKLGVYALRGTAGAVLFFLILPILVIVPLSFNSQPYFTFTAEMLAFEADAYSLRWYKTIVENPNWLLAIQNSFIVGVFATIVATLLGTVAAVGLASSEMPFRRTITALLLSPMIVPLIIIAAGMFFFYTRFGLVGTFPGLIIAHAALGIPFVIVTVTATLVGFDRSLYNAGLSLGTGPGSHIHARRPAPDPAGRHLGRALRFRHVVRRGGAGSLPRGTRPAHHSPTDVLGSARADQSHHPGGGDAAHRDLHLPPRHHRAAAPTL